MTKDLTEQWKNGELEGEYYIETHDGKHYVCELQTKSGVKNKRLPFAKSFNGYVSNKSVAKVLAPVPSYEKWQKYVEANESMFRVVKMLNKDNYQLEKDIDKLKELLKECKHIIEWYKADYKGADVLNEDVITKIDKELK